MEVDEAEELRWKSCIELKNFRNHTYTHAHSHSLVHSLNHSFTHPFIK